MDGLLWTPGHPPVDPASIPTPGRLPNTPPRAIASRVLEQCFKQLTGRRQIDVGAVCSIGEGPERIAMMAYIEAEGTPYQDNYVALVPKEEGDPQHNVRCLREAYLLERLGTMDLPFQVPKVVAVWVAWGYCIMIREVLDGLPPEKPWHLAEPWQMVGEMAAAVHRIDTSSVAALVPTWPTRTDHARAAIPADLPERPEVRDALAWLAAHPPLGAPSSFLHGDLLPQNLLFDIYGKQHRPSIIDWEFALVGDPAYELAVVTGGRRAPFNEGDGLQKLLDAYHEAGGAAINAQNVCYYELCLQLAQYKDALENHPQADTPEGALQTLRSFLTRCR